ncbi:hypothetical protein HDU77_007990 [Chytriomyces hyalinus]|nr:hypothetical protein HDU77_007990 [Chytriomyces hyalinus]
MVSSQETTPQPTVAGGVPTTELQASPTTPATRIDWPVPATPDQTEPITADASVALTVPVTADQTEPSITVTADQTVPSTDASINLAVTDQTEPTKVAITQSMGLETQSPSCATAESLELAASGPSKTSVKTSPSRKSKSAKDPYVPVVKRIPRKGGNNKQAQSTTSRNDGTRTSSTSPVKPTTPVQADSAAAKKDLEKHSPRSSRRKSSPRSKSQRKMQKAPASPESRQREPKTPTKSSRNKTDDDLACGMRNLNVNESRVQGQPAPLSPVASPSRMNNFIPRTPVRNYSPAPTQWNGHNSNGVVVRRNGVEIRYNNVKSPAAYMAKMRARDPYVQCWEE